MKKLYLCFALLALIGCEKDDPEKEVPGETRIQALVLDMDKQPVAGADVFLLDPEKVDMEDPGSLGTLKVTNNEGVAVFPAELGSFAVTAYKAEVGSASAILEIETTGDHNIELILNPPDFQNYPPQIEKINPEESWVTITSLDEVNLDLKITDDHSVHGNLNVTVECDIDGILFQGNPDSAGLVGIQVDNLEKGYHNLSITVTDEHGAESTSNFLIDVSIVIPVELTAEKGNNEILLNWSEVIEPDFNQLVVERYDPNLSEYEILATITDKTVTSFTDAQPPIAEYLDYRVRVHDTGSRRSAESIARVTLPMGPFFELGYYAITDAVLHPNQDWVYLNVNDDANKIIIYDYTNEQIIKEVELDYEPRYPVIADNGSGLQVFVPGDNNAINIYSADANFDLVKTINTLEDVNNVVPNGNGILIAGMDNYYYDYRNYHLRTFSQETGEILDSIGDRYREARIVGDPFNKNIVYGFDKTTSNYARLKSEISSDGKFISYETDNTYDYRINGRTLFAIPTGEHFVIDYAVYKTSDLSSGIDIDNETNTGITYNDTASLIYTCNRSNNKIYAWSNPSFGLVKEIETRTTPGKILYRDGQLILVGYESGKYIVDVLNIE